MSTFVKLFSLVLLLLLSLNSKLVRAQNSAKDKTQLQAQQKQIESKISYTKKLLDETKNQKKTSLNQLNLLDKQVNERKSLIYSYTSEIALIDRQIATNSEGIKLLEEEVRALKAEYANLIYQSYKSRSNYDQWMFLIASQDFYQAMRRLQYLKDYSSYRQAKAQEIVETQAKLQIEIDKLKIQKDERLGLLIVKETEAQELEKDRHRQKRSLNDLQQKENDLKQQLKQQQQEWNKLNKEIQRIIEAELKKKDKNNNRLPLSPAEVQLSKEFMSNIGKLPWPTERGTIITHFGKHRHPHLNVTVDSKGVDFQCEKGSSARAVFEGEVKNVIDLPRYRAILVQHGDYFTVYSKLEEVYVNVGDVVNTKQSLGKIWTDNDTGETILYFEIRQQVAPQNPETWIIRR